MGLPAINLRKLQPMDIVNRMLCMQAIREIGKEKIYQVEGKMYEDFLMYYDDGECDIDWEFVLFKAPNHLLVKLIDNFSAKPKEEELKEKVEATLKEKYPSIIQEEKPVVKLIID